eukprot:6198062-Pleurochrysis_carterae.AAC.3
MSIQVACPSDSMSSRLLKICSLRCFEINWNRFKGDLSKDSSRHATIAQRLACRVLDHVQRKGLVVARGGCLWRKCIDDEARV